MMRQGVQVLAVLLMFSAFGLFLTVPEVHAVSSLVQQNNNGFTSSANPVVVTVTLPKGVTSGNVLLVGLEYQTSVTLASVADSIGSSFTRPVVAANSLVVSAIYIATLSSSGPDIITGQFINPIRSFTAYNVYVYEVAGVTTVGLATGTGLGLSISISTSSVSFQAGAFLFGMIADNQGVSPSITPGSGFTLTTENSGLGVSNGQYADPVSSPTTFPATALGTGIPSWAETSVALNPSAPIPEYPLGLPVLAILIIIAYGVVRRRVRT
jgi:hypothetical protein